MNPDFAVDPDSYIAFTESGFDGTNIFSLEQHDTNRLKSLVAAKVYNARNFVSALGHVEAGSNVYMDQSLLQFVWLAYASQPYFANLKTGKAPTPFFAFSTIAPRTSLPVEFIDATNTPFMEFVNWLSDGTYQSLGPNGSITVKGYAPPYNTNRWLQARFATVSWRNLDDLKMPAAFSLAVYTWRTNAPLLYSMRGLLISARKPASFSFIPAITTKTTIQDFRFDITHPIGYGTHSHFLVTDQELIRYQQGLKGKNVQGLGVGARRMCILIAMALLAASPICVFVFRAIRKRATIHTCC